MGYNGKGPINKHQEGITEPLQLPSQFARAMDKMYHLNKRKINIRNLSGEQEER